MKKIFILSLSFLFLISCNRQGPEKTQSDKTNTKEKNDYIAANITLRNKSKQQISQDAFVAEAGNLGVWHWGDEKLPVFRFTSQLPVKEWNKKNQLIPDPPDPWFLLGNYRFTTFINVSGEYSLFTLERAIARLNYRNENKKHVSWATIRFKEKTDTLTGLGSALGSSSETIKEFGTGYARFEYFPESGLKINRTLSVLPSKKITSGNPAMLVSVEIENNTTSAVEMVYSEGMEVKYDMRFWHNWPYIEPLADYFTVPQQIDKNNFGMVHFNPVAKKPLVFSDSLDMARADAFPPAVCLQAFPGNKQKALVQAVNLDTVTAKLEGSVNVKIPSGEKTKFHFIIGTNQYKNPEKWNELTAELQKGISTQETIPFRKQWQQKLPDFDAEVSENIKLEMMWHAYVLYSMANWNEFYNEVFIPQGNVYEYELGVSACMNDWMDHVMPVIYFDTELAKSILRFGLKHADFRGSVKASDEGAGLYPKSPWQKSHSQLYILMAMAEYLNVTGDADFLNEEIPFFGYPHTAKGTVLDRLERLFRYIRDKIYHGKHGMPRVLLSDNNDCLYYFYDNAYSQQRFHTYFGNAESFSNTAMAALYFKDLIHGLKKVKGKLPNQDERINQFIAALDLYQKRQVKNIKNNWGEKPWVPRLLVGDRVFGKDTIFNETQCYVIGMDEIAEEKRRNLWNTLQQKAANGEKKGCRYTVPALTISPDGNTPDDRLGEHEMGGIWYYTNAPLIVGYSDIDKQASLEAFQKLTLMQHAKDYPNYWVGMWSAPDAINSSISEDEGTTSSYTRPFPVYCAHPHAWVLWMYYRLNK